MTDFMHSYRCADHPNWRLLSEGDCNESCFSEAVSKCRQDCPLDCFELADKLQNCTCQDSCAKHLRCIAAHSDSQAIGKAKSSALSVKTSSPDDSVYVGSGWCRYGSEADIWDLISFIYADHEATCERECRYKKSCTAYAFEPGASAGCNLYRGGPYTHGDGRNGTVCYRLREVFSTVKVFSSPAPTSKYWGGAIEGEKLYFVPSDANNVGIFDPADSSFSTVDISSTISTLHKYSAGVVENGKLYLVPDGANNIGVFDINAKELNVVNISSEITVDRKYSGGSIENGKLYMVPFCADSVGIFDISTDSFTTVDISSTISADYKYYGGVLYHGKYYMVPFFADNVGVFDTASKTFSTEEIAIYAGTAVERKYSGGVIENDKLYMIPFFANNVGIFDTATGSFSSVDISSSITTGYKYWGGVLHDHKIYFVPCAAGSIGVFDTVQNSFATVDISLAATPGNHYSGGIRDGGKLYFVPYSADNVGIFPLPQTQLGAPASSKSFGYFCDDGSEPSSEGCCSSPWNKHECPTWCNVQRTYLSSDGKPHCSCTECPASRQETDALMNTSWMGTYQTVSSRHLDYVARSFGLADPTTKMLKILDEDQRSIERAISEHEKHFGPKLKAKLLAISRNAEQRMQAAASEEVAFRAAMGTVKYALLVAASFLCLFVSLGVVLKRKRKKSQQEEPECNGDSFVVGRPLRQDMPQKHDSIAEGVLLGRVVGHGAAGGLKDKTKHIPEDAVCDGADDAGLAPSKEDGIAAGP